MLGLERTASGRRITWPTSYPIAWDIVNSNEKEPNMTSRRHLARDFSIPCPIVPEAPVSEGASGSLLQRFRVQAWLPLEPPHELDIFTKTRLCGHFQSKL